MLLRRTRADQVARNLAAVLERYPGPTEMAAASLTEVEQALRPFGLYWRARTLHAAATKLSAEHASTIPSSADELMALPGVGPYVAAATLSALSHEDVILVDTNTVRVAARVADCYRPGDIRRKREVQQAIRALFGGPAPAATWWAVLDLAATICLPREPVCSSCPIRDLCVTGSGNH
jgi:A/G-specific adenine glycosylase